METWYQTTHGIRINPIDVERHNATSIWINGRRSNRISRWACYYPTWQDAKAALLEKAEADVASLRNQLERANGYLGNVKGLKDPQA